MPRQAKMKYRGPVGVLLLPLFTFGIYTWVWYVGTKDEMNRFGANIPTSWLLIIPFVNIWWLWCYSVGAEEVTDEGISQAVAFLVLLFLGTIGMAIVQNAFNTHEQ